MSINLHIQAVDGPDLRRQIAGILGIYGWDAVDNGEKPAACSADLPVAGPAKDVEVEAPKATRTRRSTKGDTAATAQEEAREDVKANTASDATDAAKPGEQAGAGARTAVESKGSDQQAASSSTSAASTGSDDGSEITIDMVRELTLAVVDKRGKEGIEKVLSEFGAARSTQVPEEQWGELVAALRDALED